MWWIVVLLLTVPIRLDADEPKPREAVIINQIKGDKTAADFRVSGDKLAKKLEGQGQTVDTVTLGDLPNTDVPSLDKLKAFLLGTLGNNDCYHSLNSINHCRE